MKTKKPKLDINSIIVLLNNEARTMEAIGSFSLITTTGEMEALGRLKNLRRKINIIIEKAENKARSEGGK